MLESLENIKYFLSKEPLCEINKYLQEYAVICACGDIEQKYKELFTNRLLHKTKNIELTKYLTENLFHNGFNPNYDNIMNFISKINKNAKIKLKTNMKKSYFSSHKILSQSLCDLRNRIAHGGTPSSISIIDIIKYYQASLDIYIMVKNILHKDIISGKL